MSNLRKVRVSRRNLLKTVTVAGGSLAASMFLPAKWAKPLLRVGVLPVHAQTSNPPLQTYQIVASTAEQEPLDGCLLNLSVTIFPADNGIQMQMVICDLSGNAPVCDAPITSPTVAGVAAFALERCFGATPITVTFSFANASLCSANCSRQYSFPQAN